MAKAAHAHERIMLEQLSIAINALMSISSGEPEARATARSALLRIIEKIPEADLSS